MTAKFPTIYINCTETLALRKVQPLNDYWVSYNPRTNQPEVGGSWNDWVAFAHLILEADFGGRGES